MHDISKCGVVDQNVQSPEMIHACSNAAGHLVRITQVGSMKKNPLWKRIFRRGTRTGDNLITRRAKGLHQTKPNALGPPGDPNGTCSCHGGTMGDQGLLPQPLGWTNGLDPITPKRPIGADAGAQP